MELRILREFTDGNHFTERLQYRVEVTEPFYSMTGTFQGRQFEWKDVPIVITKNGMEVL